MNGRRPARRATPTATQRTRLGRPAHAISYLKTGISEPAAWLVLVRLGGPDRTPAPGLQRAGIAQPNDPITVVLVEDHLALRKGIELLLGRRGHVIAGATGDARTGYELIQPKPDVALVDIRLPDESGAELTRKLPDEDPELGPDLHRDRRPRGDRGSARLRRSRVCAQGGTDRGAHRRDPHCGGGRHLHGPEARALAAVTLDDGARA